MKITDQTILFIIGPTAVGKSELALRLAEALDGEIISADSMQIYRGMDIGTGKPTQREQKKIRHHLIDIYSTSRTFSVFDFYRHALKAIVRIRKRKKIPIIVGGTGFYIRALLEGLEPSPPPDPKVRKKIESELSKKGLDFLIQKLAKMNPEKIHALDVKNPRRVIRALEIELQKNKKTKSKQTALLPIKNLGFETVVIGLMCEREKLYAKIDDRVTKMFSKGWVREVERLSVKRISKTARQAIGYSRILTILEKKDVQKSDFIGLAEQVKIDTRRYAKRQLTWFRKEKVNFWMDVSSASPSPQFCQTVLTRLKQPFHNFM